jgi:hypothetical protein
MHSKRTHCKCIVNAHIVNASQKRLAWGLRKRLKSSSDFRATIERWEEIKGVHTNSYTRSPTHESQHAHRSSKGGGISPRSVRAARLDDWSPRGLLLEHRRD